MKVDIWKQVITDFSSFPARKLTTMTRNLNREASPDKTFSRTLPQRPGLSAKVKDRDYHH